MGRHHRQFSPEFKRDAVELVRSSGRPISEVVRETFAAAERQDPYRATGAARRAHLSSILNGGPGVRLIASALGVDGDAREREIAAYIAGWINRFGC